MKETFLMVPSTHHFCGGLKVDLEGRGIIRTRKGLERALADINYFSHRIFKFYQKATLNREIIELRNAVINAYIIVRAATHNKSSIGCHFIKE